MPLNPVTLQVTFMTRQTLQGGLRRMAKQQERVSFSQRSTKQASTSEFWAGGDEVFT